MDLKNIDIKDLLEKAKQKIEELLKKRSKKEASEEMEEEDVVIIEEDDEQEDLSHKPTSLLNKLPRAPKKKLIIYAVLGVIGLIIIYVVWQSWSSAGNERKVTNYVMQQVANQSALTQALGSSIRSTSDGKGKVQMPAMTGQITIPVKGSMGAGSLEVTLSNGNLEQIWLVKSDGSREDITQAQQKATAAAQQQAAQQAKQQAIANGFNQAISAMESKNYPGAIPGFTNAVEANYRTADAYEYLGIIYSQQGDYNNCILNFSEFLKLKPDDASGHYQLAYCYLERYDTQNALAELTKACQLGKQEACQAKTQVEAQVSQSGSAEGIGSPE